MKFQKGNQYGKKNKGFKHSEETKKLISLNHLSEKNGMWKGDEVGLGKLHEWIKRRKPKIELCECCNKNKSYDLANISGKYKRDINDFEWLCRSCHMHKDNRIKNLKQFREEKK